MFRPMCPRWPYEEGNKGMELGEAFLPRHGLICGNWRNYQDRRNPDCGLLYEFALECQAFVTDVKEPSMQMMTWLPLRQQGKPLYYFLVHCYLRSIGIVTKAPILFLCQTVQYLLIFPSHIYNDSTPGFSR